MQAMLLLLSFCTTLAAKAAPGEPLLALTDGTLQAALEENPLMLLTIGVEGCEPCAMYERRMQAAR